MAQEVDNPSKHPLSRGRGAARGGARGGARGRARGAVSHTDSTVKSTKSFFNSKSSSAGITQDETDLDEGRNITVQL